MKVEQRIDSIEEILGTRRSELGESYSGYRNHVYRMAHFCFALHDLDETECRKVIIAACFHDLGIWTDNTFDYLPPSIDLAAKYLARERQDSWIPEVKTIIDQHHRIRKLPSDSHPLAEVFRKGDLVDLSFGAVRFGLSRTYIRAVKAEFPNNGFHKQLVSLAGKWIGKHPLNPIPVLKW